VLQSLRLPLIGVCAFAVYLFAVQRLSSQPPAAPKPELVTTLPLAAQVLFAGGDRYLAANLSGFRVLVAETQHMRAEDYAVQSRLQDEISWLNPGHEDNYYIAAAILPWAGEVDATQRILDRAAQKRTFDWLPLFYYGFGRYNFYKDPVGGSQALSAAIPRARDAMDATSLQVLALAWAEKGYSTGAAAGVVSAMAATAPKGALRNYLQRRADRLQALASLREAAERYEQRFGRRLEHLDDLVASGILPALPADPFNQGYALDAQGQPVFRDRK
jgi:hypothetical protein